VGVAVLSMVLLNPIQVSKYESAVRRSECGRKCDPKCLHSFFYGDDELLEPYQIVAEQLPSDLIGIATAIRTSIIRSRDAQDLENWLSTASDCMLSTINSGKSFFFRAYDEVLTVNSNSS